MKLALLISGSSISVGAIFALIWSIVVPERRVWPLRKVSPMTLVLVWLPTLVAFGSALGLGLLDWNGLEWPGWVRWVTGLPLVILGNVVVWTAVARIGVHATSGGPDRLHTGGWYRWSRNPQYVADLMIVAGWTLLSASLWVIPVTAGIAIALLIAPFAEEPWLRRAYGADYENYRRRTARFIDVPRCNGFGTRAGPKERT